MATYNKEFGGIQYSKLPDSSDRIWTVPQKSGKFRISHTNTYFDTNPVDVVKCINAVEIDWNGAILPAADIQSGNSVEINSTSDLLKLINEMQKEIYVLSAAVIAIGTGNQ